MSIFLNRIRSLFILKRMFYYCGKREEMDALLQQPSGKNEQLLIKKIDQDSFMLSPKFSVGTLSFGAGGGFSIRVNLTILKSKKDCFPVVVFTKFRPENYLIIFILISQLIITAISHSFRGTIIAVVTCLACLAWFNLIYKMQEERVVKIAIKKLHLKKEKLYS